MTIWYVGGFAILIVLAQLVSVYILLRRTRAQSQYSAELQSQLVGQLNALQQSYYHQQQNFSKLLHQFPHHIREELTTLKSYLQQQFPNFQQLLVNQWQQASSDIRDQIATTLRGNTENITQRLSDLTHQTQQQLLKISDQVDKRLYEGFDKTTAIFSDIVKRLALIDEAQKKITELSTNVVSLQAILADKRARGHFGEMQLHTLIKDLLPENYFVLQHTFSNSSRVDCLLKLPEPTGHMAIDAKFPLEGYRRYIETASQEPSKKAYAQQFRRDIEKHIHDIATKYIIGGETADSAVMFIPSEAIFAEIHAYFPEVVTSAHQKRVWLVSPTTLMAILTTASSVIKDVNTRQQVNIIQEHIQKLAQDFGHFQKHMLNLAKHIDKAQQDVQAATRSATKLTHRFSEIEKGQWQTEMI